MADAVVLAHVGGDEPAYSWHACMVQLIAYDAGLHHRMGDGRGGFLSMRYGTGGLVQARNMAAHDFLRDYPDADWLFWLDTDMGFAPDTLERLLQAADPVERPIVGALCFGQHELGPDGMGGWRTQATPTIYDWVTLDGVGGYAVRWDYPPNTVTRTHATGSACVVVHRSVLEKVRAEFGTWYDRVPNIPAAQLLGEDLSLCVRAGALDIPVYVHTGVKTTHYKPTWVSEETYLRERVALAILDQPSGTTLTAHVDIPASLETLERSEHVQPGGMLKLPADLDRYKTIIEATRPEVIVETGTRTGDSAWWFARQGHEKPCDVITVDIQPVKGSRFPLVAGMGRVTPVTGDSADPEVAAKVAKLVDGRRCMVSLDSDHSAAHVAKEIDLYGPLVSEGCYLVVEDGIFGYATRTLRTAHGLGEMVGSPLDPVAEKLDGNPDWSRDIATERMSPTSHHPAGFWLRVAS